MRFRNLRSLFAALFASSVSLTVPAVSPGDTWKGDLKCGPLLVGSSSPEFSIPLTMTVSGKDVVTIRETDRYREQLRGVIEADGGLTLTGEGFFKNGAGAPWITRLQGQFKANRFTASGAVFGHDGTKRRDCSVDLTDVARLETNPPNGRVAVTTDTPSIQQSSYKQAELIRLSSRPSVEQRYALFRISANPTAVAVLLTGGDGILKMESQGEQIQWSREGNSFLTIKAKDYFRDFDTAVAVVDAPSDWRGFGHPHEYRVVNSHVTDIGAVVKDIKNRIPKAKVYLIGTSSGTVSAAYVGRALGNEIDGVVLTSTITQSRLSLSGFDYSAIKAPLLFVHQVNDPCQYTPYWAVKGLEEKYPFIKVVGGETARDNGCGPNGPHGFLGREYEVVREVKNWMLGRPFEKEIK